MGGEGTEHPPHVAAFGKQKALPTMANETAEKVIDQVQETSVEATKLAVTSDLEAKRSEANDLIRRYALFGTATGLIPMVGVDILAATAVQTKMIKDLADVYEFDIDDQLLRTAITSGITAIGGRLITQVATMLAETVSPLKMFVGGATNAAVSGFLTLEMGNLYQTKMELGVNPADIGVMDIVNHIVAQVQEGKWDPAKLSLTHQLSGVMGR